MADIQITEDEINLVTALIRVTDDLSAAGQQLSDIRTEMSEVYEGTLSNMLDESLANMQNHISRLIDFYSKGATYIYNTWENAKTADKLSACKSIYNNLYGGE